MLVMQGPPMGGRHSGLGTFVETPAPPGALEGDGVALWRVVAHIARSMAARSSREAEEAASERAVDEREAASGSGRVDPGGRRARPAWDAERAAKDAVRGLVEGLFVVVIDGVERRDPEAPVRLTARSRVVFVPTAFWTPPGEGAV